MTEEVSSKVSEMTTKVVEQAVESRPAVVLMAEDE